MLHAEEGLQSGHFRFIGAVSHGAAFGGQFAGCHPPTVLFFLNTRSFTILFQPQDLWMCKGDIAIFWN